MRFTAAAALFFGAVAMAETVTITQFSVHNDNNVVDGYSFHLSGDDATDLTCAGQTSIPSDIVNCGDSKYRFQLGPAADSSTFSLRVYHEVGTAVGVTGTTDIATHCRSGGGSTNVCEANNDSTTIELTS
ncbi:hypothetical protein F4810DRAFT_143502 [Camillea tinctor]|nr:hypothetical protein F4810DRAFT_143502 [Camillea tinctor]